MQQMTVILEVAPRSGIHNGIWSLSDVLAKLGDSISFGKMCLFFYTTKVEIKHTAHLIVSGYHRPRAVATQGVSHALSPTL